MPSWTIKELPPLGRVLRLRLTGDVDTRAGLPEALAEAGRPSDHLLLEVSQVTRLASAALGVIAREEHHRAVSGGSLALQGATPSVQRQLARAGLLHLAVAVEPVRATA